MPDARLAPQSRPEILDQRDVGRCPAHVERQHIGVTRIARDPHRPGDPAGRPRHQQIDRRGTALFGRHQPAVRTQQRQFRLAPPLGQVAHQIADIARHRRPHRAVGDGRQRALIFLHLGQDVRRNADRHPGQFLRNDLRHAPLVDRVEVRVDQADGDRLDLFFGQPADVDAQRGLVEIAHDFALRPDPTRRLDRRLQRRHRLGLGPHDPRREPARDQASRDLEDVAIALGHDQPDPRDLVLEHGIGRDRRAVEEQRQFARPDPRRRAHRLRAGDDRFGRIMRRRRHLVAPCAASGIVDHQQVGERAPDIDSKTIAHALSRCCSEMVKSPARPTRLGRALSIIPASHLFAASASPSAISQSIPLRSNR